jgi:hypothetical protein
MAIKRSRAVAAASFPGKSTNADPRYPLTDNSQIWITKSKHVAGFPRTIESEPINRTSMLPNGAKNCLHVVVDAVISGGNRFTNKVVTAQEAEPGCAIINNTMGRCGLTANPACSLPFPNFCSYSKMCPCYRDSGVWR